MQALQHETEERLIYDHGLCVNCRDPEDEKHFSDLRLEIYRGAQSGAILLFDSLSAMIPILNHNRGYRLPAVDRQTSEFRLLKFDDCSNDSNPISCRLVISNLNGKFSTA